jgi:NAD(P)H-hydrate epimerase
MADPTADRCMEREAFRTGTGRPVTAVTAEEMARVDRVAVEEVGLEVRQMMENAGCILAHHVRAVADGSVLVVAGNGGNGGGGLVCARHLANRGVDVQVVLDRPAEGLTGDAAHQHRILAEMDVPIGTGVAALEGMGDRTVVDALIGYGLSGAVRQPADAFIEWMVDHALPVVSLDVPSGLDATTGEPRPVAVHPARTVTLALPKTGLKDRVGTLYLADIAIPQTVYERLDIPYERPFDSADWARLTV